MHALREEYNLGPIFYVDTWPAVSPTMVIESPDIAQQILGQHRLLKHPEGKLIVPLVGEESLVLIEGQKWKKWRAAFNPGFSAGHLMTLVPGIVDTGTIFTEILTEHANNGNVFRLEEAATNLTVDVIGKIVMYVLQMSQSSITSKPGVVLCHVHLQLALIELLPPSLLIV